MTVPCYQLGTPWVTSVRYQPPFVTEELLHYIIHRNYCAHYSHPTCSSKETHTQRMNWMNVFFLTKWNSFTANSWKTVFYEAEHTDGSFTNQFKNIQVPIHVRTTTANGQSLKKKTLMDWKANIKKVYSNIIWFPSHMCLAPSAISNAGILYFFTWS